MSLQAHRLSQTRGERTLFAGLDFELHPGEALWVKGANGAGKTSLLRVLCGLAQPSEGELRWLGRPVAEDRARFHAALLWFGHASGVKDELSARENVMLGAALAGQRCSETQAGEALARLGLPARAAELPARALSQGQRRRVALARLFVDPVRPLLVLDEPFDALDAASVGTLRVLLEAHLARGGLAVYTTHQPLALRAARLHTLDLDHEDAPRCAAH